MSLTILCCVMLLTATGVFADVLLKLGGKPGAKTILYCTGAVLLYLGAIAGWFWLLKQTKLLTLGCVYQIMALVMITSVSFFYFKEPISAQELCGVILGILSIALVATGKK